MVLKRIFDVVFSLIGLIFLLPFLIIVAILIKILMPGPVFFIQKRVGQYGRVFRMYKFRSMTVNHSGSSITISGEARITPFGKVIRQYKIDELPELLNILIGDMSFVGPRPDVPGYADLLKGRDRLILNLKPGITSPASLKYLNEEEILAKQVDPILYNDQVIFPDKIRLNLEYYNRRTILLDFKIIVYTIFRQKLKEGFFN